MKYEHRVGMMKIGLLCGLLQSCALTSTAWAQTKMSIVKVDGDFGQEISKQPFEEALLQAERSGIDVLVFEWNSQGGRADIGMSVGDAIAAAPDGLRIVSVIDRAFGATVFGLAASDELLVIEGSRGKTVISFGIDDIAPEGETDEEQAERLKELEELRTMSLEKVTELATASGQPVGAYRAMMDPAARYIAESSGVQIPMDTSGETTLEYSALSAAESGFAIETENGRAEAIAAALGLDSFELVRTPSTKFLVRQKALTAQMRRVDVLERKLMKEVADVVDEWGRLQEAIVYTEEADPRKFKYPSTPFGSTRVLTGAGQRQWTRNVNEYGSRLTNLKRLMETAARSKDNMNELVVDRNAAIDVVSESIGHPYRTKGITLDLDETDIEGLDVIWEWCLAEIRWCEHNQTRSQVSG